MNTYEMPKIRLDLFDGGAGAAGDGAGAADGGAQGDAQANPGNTRRGKTSGEFQNVRFGKQAAAGNAEGGQGTVPPDAGEGKADVITTSNTLEERKKAYRDLINGEYKDLYTEDTQRIINRRFKETQNLEQKVGQYQPVMDMLLARYKIGDGDVSKLMTAIENDDAYWSEAAEEAGMSVEQYKKFQKLQRDFDALQRANQQRQRQDEAQKQLDKWYREADELKKLYPTFELEAEVQNRQFLSMLKSGVPVQHAYEVTHMEEIKAGIAAMQARATEKQVVDGIRAKGARPQENGTSSQSAFVVKDDPSKWSKKDRDEVIRRVMRGETINL